jgi:hypothetical protein
VECTDLGPHRGDLDDRDPVVVAGMRYQARVVSDNTVIWLWQWTRPVLTGCAVVDSESREEHLWNHSKHMINRTDTQRNERDARIVTYQ